MKITLLVSLLLVFASAAMGQTFFHTLPAGYENAKGAFGTNDTFNRGPPTFPGCHWMFIYDWTQLAHQCPVTIQQIAFRPNNDSAVVAGATLVGCTVTLSTQPALPHSGNGQPLDATNPECMFTLNQSTINTPGGTPETVIFYQGDIVVPPYTGTGTGAGPAPFIVQIPFNVSPFFYDPTLKRDLVVDIDIPAAQATGMLRDGALTSFEGGQFGNRDYGFTAPVTQWCGDWANYDYTAIIEVGYDLGSLGTGAHFELIAFTPTGSGDVTLGFTTIPANATQGVTIISTTAFAGGEFGRGPAFGLWPDATSFLILGTPAAPGGVFKWTWPVSPPLFPAQGISTVGGPLGFLVGSPPWELVGVAFDGTTGKIAGVTAPAQLVW